MKNSDRRIRTIGLVLEDAFTDFASDIIHSVSLVVKDLSLMCFIKSSWSPEKTFMFSALTTGPLPRI